VSKPYVNIILSHDEVTGMDAYKRVQEFAAKQYEFTPKVLTPGIFSKTLQLPPTLNLANKIRSSKTDQSQSQPKPSVSSCSKAKVAQFVKQKLGTATEYSQRDMNSIDYDLNLTSNPVEIQGKSCFKSRHSDL
jgi:hypothetical protein